MKDKVLIAKIMTLKEPFFKIDRYVLAQTKIQKLIKLVAVVLVK